MVFDYSSPSAVQDIKTATDDQLGLIFDCVGGKNSPRFCYEAMGKSGGKYLSARHLSSQGTCELHLSRDSLSLAYSSWLCI
jgi:hypothetical protein